MYFSFAIDRPCLDDLNATSKEGKIYIHYVCKVSENFPLKSIKWTKNKSELEVPCNKYRGGGVADNCVEILMPDEDDKGLYTCTVLNAVGPDSKKVKLGTTLSANYTLHLIFMKF